MSRLLIFLAMKQIPILRSIELVRSFMSAPMLIVAHDLPGTSKFFGILHRGSS